MQLTSQHRLQQRAANSARMPMAPTYAFLLPLPLPQAHEQLAAAQDAAHEMQDALKGARERAEAADLSLASLKAQLAEAKKEADARERALQARGRAGVLCAAGWPAGGLGRGSFALMLASPLPLMACRPQSRCSAVQTHTHSPCLPAH